MSHITSRKAYESLQERLNRFPQGAPPSETLYKILEILFSEKEAKLVAQLPIKPFTARKAASIWGTSSGEAAKVLQGLAERCILLDIESKDEIRYILPPPMAGFLEFSMMRTRDDINQHLLAELYYQYMNVEEEFVKELFSATETNLGRVFINEEVLAQQTDMLHVLDFVKASHIIKTAKHIGIGMCYCRHKMEHVGKNCNAPIDDICMTFGNAADALIRHEYARRIDASECMEILSKTYDYNLVQFGENVQNGVSFICNCCGCCCEALVGAKKFGSMHPIETTGFVPELNEDTCVSCGKCEKACQLDIIKMGDSVSNQTAVKTKKIPVVDKNLCLGCGLCVRACPNKSLFLRSTGRKIITPPTSVHRIVYMAIEKGLLQELIFDNKALYSHRAMAAILSAILKMPPIKKAMASEQMKSVYLNKLISRQKI
ncbi:MAG: 4Fe-4S dicluster domain-containing protein [Saccharofermentanales bacterium]